MDGNLMIYVVGGLAFLALAGLGLALTGDEGGAASKRAKQIKEGRKGNGRGGGAEQDVNSQRRRQTQQMLKKLRQQDEARRKSLMPQDIRAKLVQAGLDVKPEMFWIFSAVLGLLLAALTFLSGAEGPPPVAGFEIKSRPAMVIAAGFAGFLGVPRWLLGFMTQMRHKKMTAQFADAIDIIVRGVKSGLPLTECLRIIAAESPAPLGTEFKNLTDNIQMGMTTDRALQQFYKRVPLPEVNFFVIVLTIQSKSGGNLSEALGNLSAVIRQRKMMREKIKAMSSEAKASAGIIASLPFAVGFMVYLTTPSYIMELFLKPTGHMILFMGAGLMFTGVTVMRRMINFDI
ncbi:type II secretion system F family protein [Henriciella mobilis]|uniref:Pilus assembly protein n=1 Tax=Henriciella mobilis TaxID=2305467 RepID=A0A399RQY1_9PROT|nr:type II secretion system F family protein [Henriciella mobilis]RIJ17078.1 pilus assembly protein [Henriciella mobilis]RIJ22684.1 pilus assembly protein [Henriciella mobilis]RIJ32399.1 pilus assembly protein [Henriciella mobilis]